MQKKVPQVGSGKTFLGDRSNVSALVLESVPLEDVVEHFAYAVPDHGFSNDFYEPKQQFHAYHLLSVAGLESRL